MGGDSRLGMEMSPEKADRLECGNEVTGNIQYMPKSGFQSFATADKISQQNPQKNAWGPRELINNTVSTLTQNTFSQQTNIPSVGHQSARDRSNRMVPTMAEVVKGNDPGQPPQMAGNMLTPRTKRGSPSVKSVRYVPENPHEDIETRGKSEIDDSEGSDTSESQNNATSPGKVTSSADGQQAKTEEPAQQDFKIVQKDFQIPRAKHKKIVNMYREEIRIRENRIRRLDEQLARKSEELDQLRDEQENQEERVREAQQSAFRQMKQGRWVAQEDSSIRSELSKFEGDLRSWAKQFSNADLSTLEKASVKDQECLIAALDGSVRGDDIRTPTWVGTDKLKDKSPFLLTHAMLAAYVMNNFFAKPFFFFQGDTAGLAGSTINHGQVYNWHARDGFGDNLSSLYEEMKAVDLTEAHAWRSQTLRILNTSSDSSGPDQSIKDRVKDMRKRTCDIIARSFLSGPVRLLTRLDPTKEDFGRMHQGIYDLIFNAGEVSARLWTQRTYMDFASLSSLKTFHVDNEIMTAHRLHKLDDDDHRLDGKPIIAVIQPGIVAYGDNNGENYDKRKVWAKAVVLVDED